MQVRTEDEIFGLLDARPSDASSRPTLRSTGSVLPSVTYIAVIRHPLDVALSDRDHMANMLRLKAAKLREAAWAIRAGNRAEAPPDDPAEYLRWFIDNHEQPMGSGPYGLEDYCQQIAHLLGRADRAERSPLSLCRHVERSRRRDAPGGGRARSGGRRGALAEFVQAATLDSMRARASDTAPDAHLGLWQSADRVLPGRRIARLGGATDAGGRRPLRRAPVRPGRRRTPWVLEGRSALGLGEPLGCRGCCEGLDPSWLCTEPTKYVPNRLNMCGCA